VTAKLEEGDELELDVTDDPYNVDRVNVSAAPVVVTLSKVTYLLPFIRPGNNTV
jgi:hypothetical protein